MRLYAMGKLDEDQVRSAREIAAILRHVTTGLGMKISNPERSYSGGVYDEGLLSLYHSLIYLPWANRVRDDLQLIHGLILDGESLKNVAQRHRMRWETALTKIQKGLDLYGQLRQNAKREAA